MDKTMKLSAARDGLYKPRDKDLTALTSPKDKRDEIKAMRQQMDEYKEFKK